MWGWVAVCAGLYLYAVAQMLPYPYPLEVYETSNLAQSIVFLKTGQIYAEPTFHHQAMMYMPLYFYATAAAMTLFGKTLLAGRVVSLLATLAIVGIIYRWLRREQFPSAFAAAAAATFLGLFYMLGKWYHTVHVDMLMVALLWAGLLLLHFSKNTRHAIVAGAVLALAFYTKQQTALVVAPLLLIMALYDFRRAFVAGFAMGAAALALVALEAWRSDGWFLYYAFEMPGSMPKRWFLWPWFFLQDLLLAQPVLVGLSGYFLVDCLRGNSDKRRYDYIGLTIGCLLSACLSRLHTGGWVNVLIPMWVGIIVMAFLGLRLLLERRPKDRLLAWALVVFQAGMLVYDPSEVRVPEAYTQAYRKLERQMAESKGQVFAEYPFYADGQLRDDVLYLRMFGFDMLQAKSRLKPSVQHDLQQALDALFSQHKLDAALLEKPASASVERYYRQERILYEETSYPIGLNGLPRFVYVPK